MKLLTPQPGKYKHNADSQDRKDTIVLYTSYILSRNIWVYRNTCLKRSLILYHFLRKQGTDVQICFGINYKKDIPLTERKEMEGHAWLLLNGDIYLEANPEIPKNYTTTYCFPE
jgi:hypothetical protein